MRSRVVRAAEKSCVFEVGRSVVCDNDFSWTYSLAFGVENQDFAIHGEIVMWFYVFVWVLCPTNSLQPYGGLGWNLHSLFLHYTMVAPILSGCSDHHFITLQWDVISLTVWWNVSFVGQINSYISSESFVIFPIKFLKKCPENEYGCGYNNRRH